MKMLVTRVSFEQCTWSNGFYWANMERDVAHPCEVLHQVCDCVRPIASQGDTLT